MNIRGKEIPTPQVGDWIGYRLLGGDQSDDLMEGEVLSRKWEGEDCVFVVIDGDEETEIRASGTCELKILHTTSNTEAA